MKRIIKKFWGVGLILMLLSTLFIAATPVSAADPLMWNYKFDTPGGATWGLAPGSDIKDFAVSADGTVMYAAVSTATASYLLQTTSGAAMGWSDISARLPTAGVAGVTEVYDIDTVDYVAIAPDDPNIVVVVDATANATSNAAVAISSNGGSTFSTMGFVGTAATVLSGVAVSPVVTGGFRYIAVFGTDGASPILWYYNYGAGVGGWQNAITYFSGGTTPYSPVTSNATSNIVAMQFSPNFPSDQIAVALDADSSNITAGAGALRLHALSFNGLKWDNGALGVSGYPVTVATNPAGVTLNVVKASLALLPDYDGGDDSLRVEFVGADINPTGTELGGVWRCFDNAASPPRIFPNAGVNSVAFDGTNLAAGEYATNVVWRSADPLVSSPTFLPCRSLKKIGIDDAAFNDQVIVKFAGETLLGAKQGAASAMSKSLDYGNVWNDFTLMDSGNNAFFLGNPAVQAFIAAGTITDTYMSATGDPWYLAANDGVTASVYRMSHFAMQRVLAVSPAVNLILRGISSDPGVVYASTVGGQDIYYTADGGQTRWYKRGAPANVSDLAVESSTVVYMGAGVNVYKSTNSGFTWGSPVNCKFSTGAINTLVSLSENNLLVGGTTGGVGSSTDGGATWTQTFGTAMVLGPAAGPVALAATGLGPSDYIFAADLGSNMVMRITSADMGVFKTMNNPANAPAGSAAVANTGMKLTNGVLYVVSTNGTMSWLDRSLTPAVAGTHTAGMWGTRFGPTGYKFAPAAAGIPPSTLEVSSGAPGSIMLYAVDQGGLGLNWFVDYYFEDNVALSGPALTGPADKTLVQIISQLLGNSQAVNFTWNRQSKTTAYELQVALDSAFTSNFPIAWTGDNDGDIYADIVGSTDTMSALISGFSPGVTYYWRVRASVPITGAWSETRSFTVQPTAATVPVIASPTNGATIESTKPAFSWSPVSGTTSYQFQLSEGTAFAAPVYDTTVTNAGVQLPLTITLEQGKTYFWRVRALVPVQGDWSTIANFTVAAPVPVVEPTPPVVIQQMPAPVINIPAAPPATQITIPPAPAEKVINPTYIWAIIIIGAVLVIAVIVLIVRTRRSV